MTHIDKVPGNLNLYIGSIFTLRRREALRQINVTHVVSVLRAPLHPELLPPFIKHMVVEVDDTKDENLLQYFPATNRFIQHGLDGGGGVFVHCAMGKSRSATIVIAYLMRIHNISPSEALSQLRQARSICEPNDGFMEQLGLYAEMRAPESVEENPTYQRWVYQREVELSRACNQAPEADKIHFQDEHSTNQINTFQLRCRKCRRPLATSQYLVSHPSSSPIQVQDAGASESSVTQNCAHYFVEPLLWMRPELELGKLDGRLECPKCHAHVGKYAWQGIRCTCDQWIVPGITLSKGRIDEVRKATLDIRLPPGASNPLV